MFEVFDFKILICLAAIIGQFLKSEKCHLWTWKDKHFRSYALELHYWLFFACKKTKKRVF